MIRLKKLGHVQLRVADLERSKAFYRDVLGFRVAEQDPKHGDLFMTLGRTSIRSTWRNTKARRPPGDRLDRSASPTSPSKWQATRRWGRPIARCSSTACGF